MTGDEFKTIRKKFQLTQNEIAILLGFAGPQTVKNIEGGKVRTANLVIKTLRYIDSLPLTNAYKFMEEFNKYAPEKNSARPKES